MVPVVIVTVSVAPVGNHVLPPGWWAKTSSLTVLPVTAPETVSVPVVTPAEHCSVMPVIAWVPLLATAPEDNGPPMVPNPMSARPPVATATPASRTAARRPMRAPTL